MELQTVLFYAFAAVLVFAALRVVTDRNPVHAALFLVLSFSSATAIWILLQAEFLAIVLVLVYVGAVMVLFLFVVMMADVNIEKLREGFWSHLPLAAGIGVVIVLEMAAILFRGFLGVDTEAPAAAANIGTTRELGLQIYTHYIYAFEIAAVVLLVAMVAAVSLTLRRRKDRQYFDPGQAVRVRAQDRLRIVRMKADSTRSAAAAQPATPSEQK